MPSKKKQCSVEGCPNGARALGLCNRHRRNLKETGVPEIDGPKGRGGTQKQAKPDELQKPKLRHGPTQGEPQRDSKGHFVRGNSIGYAKGQSGNPGGMYFKPGTATLKEVLQLAREQSPASIRTLALLRDDESQPGQVRVNAANSLLNRAWGVPATAYIGELAGDITSINDDESAGPLNALLLAARLEPKSRAKTIDATAVEVEPSAEEVEEAVRISKAVTNALASGLPEDEVAKIVADAIRKRAASKAEPGPTLDLAPEPSPAPQGEPQVEAAPSAHPEPKAAPEPAKKPTGMPMGFADFHAKKEEERQRQRGNGIIKLV